MTRNLTKNLLIATSLTLALPAACSSDDTEAADPVEQLINFGDERADTSIQTLSGCFLVRYHFVENGQNDFFFENNIEYMDVSANGDGFVARNFLVIPMGPGQTLSFLHWVQEWSPVSGDIWSFTVKDGEGNLRYETEGVWRFNQFESVPANAVKPNRDVDLGRDDYDVLERRNAIQLAGNDWYQSEINVKSLDSGEPVSSELGWIVYAKQTDETPCDPAKEIASQTSLTQTQKNWRQIMDSNDGTWASPL